MATPIDRERVQELVSGGAALIDTLPEKDYRDSHLPGAVNVPLKRLDATSAASLPRDRPIVVYCYDTQ
jgi:rhodanese-related sulfurtransferase